MGRFGGWLLIGKAWPPSCLSKLAAEGRWVVTILRTELYRGLESFTDVGPFLPLARDRDVHLLHQGAAARFSLALPEQPGQSLSLTVALN
jgi:hypothetical protein